MSKWSKKSINTGIEKDIVTAMIVNDRFLTEVQSMILPEYFKTTYTRTVAFWCVDYFKKYKRAPGKDIQELFNVYARSKNSDENQVELIEEFLSGLSEEYKDKNFNLNLYLDKTEMYFRTRKIEIHKENLNVLLMKDKIKEAEKEIATYKQVARPSTTGIDILNDNINKHISEEFDFLFKLPGDLGKMIGGFSREDFVSIAAPMKRGKTWWMIFIAMTGLLNGYKVLYYDMESGKTKMLRRFYQYMTGQPKSKQTIQYPYFDEDNNIDVEEIKKTGLTGNLINKKRKEMKMLISDGNLRMMNNPQYSTNIEDIKNDLDNLEHYHNFVPDIILVDYADILKSEPYTETREERHRLNKTWGGLRGLAQEKHCLVVTATQTNKLTFKRDIEQGDMAEDTRKLAHVTHMISLNQTNDDKKNNVMRVGTIVLRDDEFYIDNEVVVLQCLAIGRPYLDSRFKKFVKNL